MSRAHRRILTAALIALAPSAAWAQHAEFVLLGNPNPQAARAPASHRFVHPATAPYHHEDSFVTTDVRLWAAYHDFPRSSPIAGGNAKVVAAQVRLALTDQLQLVAYKDGWTDMDSGLIDDEGWNDIAAGLKWNFLQDWDNQLHAAVGVGYEIASGDDEILHDDDEWRLWLSVNKGFDRLHLGGTVNFFLADDHNQGAGNSDRLSWHVHADYYVCEWFSPLVELNGYHVLDRGFEAVPFSGADVLNLGGGDDLVTLGLGGEFRPMSRLAVRAAYELPLTKEEDIFGYRWTFSLIWSF